MLQRLVRRRLDLQRNNIDFGDLQIGGRIGNANFPPILVLFDVIGRWQSKFQWLLTFERAARRVEEFGAIAKSRDGTKGLALWTDGHLSERLCAELKSRGIAYRVDALTNL